MQLILETWRYIESWQDAEVKPEGGGLQGSINIVMVWRHKGPVHDLTFAEFAGISIKAIKFWLAEWSTPVVNDAGLISKNKHCGE